MVKALDIKGVEVHHLIEKRFANLIDIDEKDILSVALDKDTHKKITKKYRELIGYRRDFGNRRRTTNVDAQEVWDATVKVYKDLGMEKYLEPLEEQLMKAG